MLSFGNGVRQQVDQIKFPTIAAALLTPRGILRGRLSDGSPARCLSGPRAAVCPHSLGDRNDSGFALQPGLGTVKTRGCLLEISNDARVAESFAVHLSMPLHTNPFSQHTMAMEEFLKAYRLTPEERRLRDEEVERDAALAAESERPLVAEIRTAGWSVDSVWDLANFHTDHRALAPILIAHLSKDYHPKIKMAIARALITAKVRSEVCSKELVRELYSALTKTGGLWEGVQQSLAHALAKLAHPAIAPAVQDLAHRCRGTFLADDLNEACKCVKIPK